MNSQYFDLSQDQIIVLLEFLKNIPTEQKWEFARNGEEYMLLGGALIDLEHNLRTTNNILNYKKSKGGYHGKGNPQC